MLNDSGHLRALDQIGFGRGEESEALRKAAKAFDETRDTRFYVSTPGQLDIVKLVTGLASDADPGFVMITAQPGCGKTMLRTVLHNELREQGFVCVSFENGLLDFDDMLLEIVSQLQGQRVLPADLPDRYSRLAVFKDLLLETVVKSSSHLVLLIDESQHMTAQTLEGIRNLTNIGAERRNYISPVFFGQPVDAGQKARNQSIRSRIAASFEISALTRSATESYLRFRLKAAGVSEIFPFEESAIDAMQIASKGVPRTLNRLCKLALTRCCETERSSVSPDVIREISKFLPEAPNWPDSCLLTG
jgi:general secretion pathway protein A